MSRVVKFSVRARVVSGLPLAAILSLGVSSAALAQQATPPAATPRSAAQAPAAAPAPEGTKLPEVQVIQEQAKPKVETADPPAPPKKQPVAAKPAPEPSPPPVKKAGAPKPAPAPAPEPVAAAPAAPTSGVNAPGGGGAPAFGTTVDMSPVPGSGIPVEKVPAAVSTVSGADISRAGQSTLEGALQARVPGVMLNDAQGNSFNTTVDYRGFVASPVPGFSQGLAVYQNGVRINESFGDIVNFDALPSNAVGGVTVMSGNPVFGLNAIGGSVNLKMKDGFDFQGAEVDTRFGSFSRRQVGVQAGTRSGPWAAYGAGELIHDGGYRNYSTSNIRRLYGDLGVRGEGNEVHLSLTHATNDFGVVAATPIQLLNLNRELTSTSPQMTHNDITMVQLNGSTVVTPTMKLAGLVYGRFFKQEHIDGNAAEIRGCTNANLFICDGEGGATDFILDKNGNRIPGIGPIRYGYGTIDRTGQDAKSFGGSAQLTEKAKLFGFDNQFLLGASYDHGHVRYTAVSELGRSNASLVVNGTGIILGGIETGGKLEFYPRNIAATNDYVGLYFSNTLDLTSQLSLTVGGRYNFANIDLDDASGKFAEINGSHSFQRFNPAAGATYKLLPGLSIYGGYSEANRAPTPGELACSDPAHPCLVESFLTDDPPLKQTVSRTWEAGLKGELNGLGLPAQITWGLGFFHTLNQDDILAIASPSEAGRGYFTNAGATLRRGVEASIELRTNNLTGYMGYTYVDATFRNSLEFAAANNSFAGPCSADPANDETFCSHVNPGDKLPGVSPHRFKIGAEYAILPQWKVGADWMWMSGQHFYGDEGNIAPQLDRRSRLDLHTSYDLTQNVQLYGTFNNVLNNRYDLYGAYYDSETLYKTSGQTLTPVRNGAPVNAFGDQRATVPAAPFAAYGGVKMKF